MKKFSQRIGIKPVETLMQINEIDIDLRTTLWNVFYGDFMIEFESEQQNDIYYRAIQMMWFNFLKKPLDDLQYMSKERVVDTFKELFLEGDWYKVYEFYEYYLTANFGSVSVNFEQLAKTLNYHLEEGNSGYRVIEYLFVPIISEVEIEQLNSLNVSTQSKNLLSINEHLHSALRLISQKPNPDYRNSIKESISMVEAISRLIVPKEKTLGKALKKLKNLDLISSVLIDGFDKLYGYTNGKDGIRHSILTTATEVTREDAQYFLVSCSAFTNYIIEKSRSKNLII